MKLVRHPRPCPRLVVQALFVIGSLSLHAATCAAILGIATLLDGTLEPPRFSVETSEATLHISMARPKPVEFEPPAVPPPPTERPAPEPIPDPPEPADAPIDPPSEERPTVHADRDAEAVVNPKPDYPRIARRRGCEGTVVVAFEVTPEGTCAGARVVQSSGYPSLDDAALVTVATRWRFRPALRNGEPVPSAQRVRFEFRLEE
ncbi:MAG: energy transducer TonB [Planctomycetes bacterium]|nr:energy transducer TonB [Planctomycetota bacterium]